MGYRKKEVRALALKDICLAVSRKLGVTKSDTHRVIRAALLEIACSLSNARPVAIRGFGYFRIQKRKRTVARNPRKPDELVELPARSVCFFKPCPKIKYALIRKTVE